MAVPLLQAFVAWRIYRDIQWRRYPALLAYLLYGAAANLWVLASGDFAFAYAVTQPPRLATHLAVVFEVFRMSCHGLSKAERRDMALWCAGFSLYSCSLVAAYLEMTPLQVFNLAGHFFHLILAAWLLALAFRCCRAELIENMEHRSYRLCMTAMLVRVFLSSAFVKGGFGFLLFRYDAAVWRTVDALSWGSNFLILLALGYGMTHSYSAKRANAACAG